MNLPGNEVAVPSFFSPGFSPKGPTAGSVEPELDGGEGIMVL